MRRLKKKLIVSVSFSEAFQKELDIRHVLGLKTCLPKPLLHWVEVPQGVFVWENPSNSVFLNFIS